MLDLIIELETLTSQMRDNVNVGRTVKYILLAIEAVVEDMDKIKNQVI